MGFESRAISARVTKQSVTIFSKTCDNVGLIIGYFVCNTLTYFSQFNNFSYFCVRFCNTLSSAVLSIFVFGFATLYQVQF